MFTTVRIVAKVENQREYRGVLAQRLPDLADVQVFVMRADGTEEEICIHEVSWSCRGNEPAMATISLPGGVDVVGKLALPEVAPKSSEAAGNGKEGPGEGASTADGLHLG